MKRPVFTVVRISDIWREQSRSLMCDGDNEEDITAGDHFSGFVTQLIRNWKSDTASCTLFIQPAIVSTAVK